MISVCKIHKSDHHLILQQPYMDKTKDVNWDFQLKLIELFKSIVLAEVSLENGPQCNVAPLKRALRLRDAFRATFLPCVLVTQLRSVLAQTAESAAGSDSKEPLTFHKYAALVGIFSPFLPSAPPLPLHVVFSTSPRVCSSNPPFVGASLEVRDYVRS